MTTTIEGPTVSMSGTARRTDPVVVIGTGPAGAAAAIFLSRAGLEPVILEAGSERAPLGFTARLRGVTVAKVKRPLKQRPDFSYVGPVQSELYEELSPGGLSNHWSCAVPRFSEEDFLDAQRSGEEFTWPIGYADVAPWYDQVEPLLRIAAGSQDTRSLPRARVHDARRLSSDWDPMVSAAAPTGRSVVVMPYANGATTLLTKSATAFNAYSQLIVPAVRKRRVSVIYDALVSRLEWSANDKRVVAVLYTDARTGREQRLPCSAVVLAAGAVNSAQILLQSKSPTFPGGLGNEHGVLGSYLHDHPLGKIVLDMPRPLSISPASYITRPPLERSKPLYAAAHMQWSGVTALARSVFKGTPGRSTEIGFSVFGTMAPSKNDHIALDLTRPAENGRSRILMQLSYTPEAVATLEQARDDLIGILSRAGWAPRIREWKVEVPGNSVHYAGTCRMHASPRYGVVDAHSRVHGVPNVVVADSGVFTTGPEKNPVLTAMALAARGSDQLARALNAGHL